MAKKYFQIKKTESIFDIRKRFNKIYPNLALHFTKKPDEAPDSKNVLEVYQEIGKAVKTMKEGKVDISPERTILDIVEDFANELKLNVAISKPRVSYDYAPKGELVHYYANLSLNPTIETFNSIKKDKEDYYHWF